jgi:GntR family transcriptional regulator
MNSLRPSKPYLVRTAVDDILADLTDGDAVPPERELAARFGVSRETVRQALHELLVEGRIERRGRRTVVSRPKLIQPLSLRSYTEGAAERGRLPGRIVITWEDIVATTDMAEALCISASDDVMHLERVLLADDQRIGLESTYLPKCRFAALADTFDPTTSLYAAIKKLGVTFGSAVERVETALPAPREAALLGTTTAMPALLLNRRTRDTTGRPIEMVRALYRGDRIAFEASLTDA